MISYPRVVLNTITRVHNLCRRVDVDLSVARICDKHHNIMLARLQFAHLNV